jgi:alpha-D-ribose 1-methylphosphonate 5-triphosphate diphosphatase PhnM
MSDHNGGSRLDRIEKIVEVIANVQRDMQQEHQLLLRAQVAQADEMQQLRKRTEEQFQSLAAAQQRMDDALTALMGTVDEILRSRRQ